MTDAFEQWLPASSEYFRSFADGRYDEAGHLWFVLPRAEVSVQRHGKDFVVGSAGCGLIDFCFRKSQSGVWAYYPIEEGYVLIAANLKEFEEGWLSGAIAV